MGSGLNRFIIFERGGGETPNAGQVLVVIGTTDS
jgi:hypothetical protein